MKFIALLLVALLPATMALVLGDQEPQGGVSGASPEVRALYDRTEALARSQAALQAYAIDEAAAPMVAPEWAQPPLDSYLALDAPHPLLLQAAPPPEE